MKQVISIEELKNIQNAVTASGKEVKYVRYDKWRKAHILIIDGDTCKYSQSSLENTIFFKHE